MSTRLICWDEGPDILVDRPMVFVGRHPKSDAHVDSVRISRRHCCLSPCGEDVVVRDLSSLNGTWINGRRVETGRLRPGDELTIGDVRFYLESEPREEADLLPSCVGEPVGAPRTCVR